MALSYNSNNLQTANIITQDIDHHSGGKRDINMLPIAGGNRSKITGSNTASKIITLRGQLVADSIAAMDDLEDTFKGYFVGKNKNLDISHGSGTRRYVVTPREPNVERPGGLMYANFSIDLLSASAFGVDTSLTALASGSGVTTTPVNWSITLGGSAEYQYPVITVTLVSGTQLTNRTMNIGNNSNGMVCSINRAWVAGDVVVIDPLADEPVTVNGLPAAFTGSIPIFEKGAGAVTYSDTFLTRSVTYDISQYRYWI